MITHRILERQKKKRKEKLLSACLSGKPHAVLSLNTKMWMQIVCLQCMPFTDSTQTLCFLTFSGLSDDASTKDWEKCTIPTFLFSQNLWHQELGEVFRQSSYSPAGYNTTGQWGQEGKGHSKRKWGRTMTRVMPRFLPGQNIEEIFYKGCKTSELIMQEQWQRKSRN